MVPINEVYRQGEEEERRQMELALLLAALVDRYMAEFDARVLLFGFTVAGASTQSQIDLAAEAFLADAGVLFAKVAMIAGQESQGFIKTSYGIDMAEVAGRREISRLAGAATAVLRERIRDARALANMGSVASGGDNVATLRTLLDGPRLKAELHKTGDYAISSLAQGALWLSGDGVVSRKIAVPVIDDRTTDLCRNRMAFQVRRWGEMFVDPVSHARWMFPPFIYGGLSRREAFHYCRTSVAPIL